MVPRDCEATSSRGKPQQVAPGVQTCRSTTRIACVKQGARQPSRPCAGEVGKVRTGTRWEVVGVERWNCKGLGGTGFPPPFPVVMWACACSEGVCGGRRSSSTLRPMGDVSPRPRMREGMGHSDVLRLVVLCLVMIAVT